MALLANLGNFKHRIAGNLQAVANLER